jgi:hypothetical protein
METDPISVCGEQPEMEQQRTSELKNDASLPVIWEALESLTSQELIDRITGLERIIEFNAAYQYPLAIYILLSRISEPDIELRTRIVKLLVNILETGVSSVKDEISPIGEIKQTLIALLAGLRTRQIFSLLQVSEFDKNTEEAVVTLLSYCSFAGGHLAQILSNRSAPFAIRCQAASFIGRIGYLDALPALERMASRLENRKDEDDAGILIGLKETIRLLYTP